MSTPTLDEYRVAGHRAVQWLAGRIGADGSLGAECGDLACCYKLPYLMQLAGRPAEAHRLLDWIRYRFLRSDGDFLTSDTEKTLDPVLARYPGYMNGWIAMAAHKLGRFDLSYPAWTYLRRSWNPALRAFAIASDRGGAEVLMTAHLGLNALYLGERGLAEQAGLALKRFLKVQPSPETRFFLRMVEPGAVQTDFPAEAAGLHVIAADQPGQAWFFIGYPMAFLAHLYRATGESEHLSTARGYLEFAGRCAPHLVGEHFAHKVAWGAAELASVTGDAAPRALSTEIAGHLIAAQETDGGWMAGQPVHTRLDQSAEVAIWLLEIAALG
jgi:hypothetical protein